MCTQAASDIYYRDVFFYSHLFHSRLIIIIIIIMSALTTHEGLGARSLFTSFAVMVLLFETLSLPKCFTVPVVSCATNLPYMNHRWQGETSRNRMSKAPNNFISDKPCIGTYPGFQPHVNRFDCCTSSIKSHVSAVRIRNHALATQSFNVKLVPYH